MPSVNFDPSTHDYSAGNALLLGYASDIAYDDPPEAAPKFAQHGLAVEKFYNVKAHRLDTQAYLVGNDQCLIVAFRGTQPDKISDWMTDLDINLVGGPGGRVHDGFNAALNSIWRDLWQDIVTTRNNRSLWVTGHSLGGGLAVLATAKLRLEKDEPVNGLYTFGQPRVGDREFARHFDADFGRQSFHYVNNNDVVARVPFRSMGYSHVGSFCYFDSEGRQRDDINWMNLILDRLRGQIKDHLVVDKLKDHSRKLYVGLLENNLDGKPTRVGGG